MNDEMRLLNSYLKDKAPNFTVNTEGGSRHLIPLKNQ